MNRTTIRSGDSWLLWEEADGSVSDDDNIHLFLKSVHFTAMSSELEKSWVDVRIPRDVARELGLIELPGDREASNDNP